MQVFKAFMKVLKKHFPMAMVYIGIFLAISMIMASSGSPVEQYMQKKLKINVIDEDNSTASKALTDYIGSKHKLVDIEHGKNEMLDALYYEKADYILVICSGYEENIKSGQTDNLFYNYQVHMTYGGILFENDVNAYIKALNIYISSDDSLQTALNETQTALQTTVDVSVKDFNEDKSISTFHDRYGSYFKFLPYIFMSILIVTLGPVLIIMNGKEVKARTNCSCISVTRHTAQLFLGSTVFVLATWLLFMIAGAIFGGQMYSSVAWIAVWNSLIFILISAGIAILIAVLSKTTRTVNLVANILALGMCFICGVFVPQSYMSEGVMKVARFLPAYWYTKLIDTLNETSGDMVDMEKCLTYIGIEGVFAIALFAVILLVVKTKHEARA